MDIQAAPNPTVEDRPNPTSSSAGVDLVTFVRRAITPAAFKIGLVVLASDLLFALIRAWQLFSRQDAGDWFRLDVDGSLPEIAQYVKFLAVAALMVYLARRTGLRWYLIWAATFTFLMLDDSLMIHERVAEGVGPTVARLLPAGVDPQTFAELGYFAVVGGVITLAGLAGMVFSPGPFRRLSIDLLLLLVAGALFAVGVDVVHDLFRLGYVGNNLFTVIEDGGEMIAVSFIVIYSTTVADRLGELPHWLSDIRRLRA